jgi:hypothetical protein
MVAAWRDRAYVSIPKKMVNVTKIVDVTVSKLYHRICRAIGEIVFDNC